MTHDPDPDTDRQATQVPSPASTPVARPRRFSQQAVHLLRTVQRINLTLSQMADQKASILMGATFVVFTIAVGQASKGVLPASLSVLALFAFASALCAVIAVLPSTGGKGQGKDHSHRNLLFFGTFTEEEEDAWVDEMVEKLVDDEEIYRAMLRDIYQNGVVMKRRKYRYLGYAYRLFVGGLCATVAVFLVEQLLLN